MKPSCAICSIGAICLLIALVWVSGCSSVSSGSQKAGDSGPAPLPDNSTTGTAQAGPPETTTTTPVVVVTIPVVIVMNDGASQPAGQTCGAIETTCGDTCADLRADSANCGACGNICRDGEYCTQGGCQTPVMITTTVTSVTVTTTPATATRIPGGVQPAAQACGEGQTQCRSTCVNIRSDNVNCGACGNVCTCGQNCVQGACSCPSGQALCGGCCQNLQTDFQNCGICGHVCPSKQYCSQGTCISCPTDLTQCGNVVPGNCKNLQTDPANCGYCFYSCGSGQSCSQGACSSCPTGQAWCGSSCKNLQTDSANCGSCGNACSASQYCSQGTCRLRVTVATPKLTLKVR